MKGSILSINIDSVLNDADTWKDPHCFRPERHLNVDMTKIVKNENHIPFGAGDKKYLLPYNYIIIRFFSYFIVIRQANVLG
jgi:hypothetical protein